MSFIKTLRETVERVDGAVASVIIGSDGITVEGYSSEPSINAEQLGAELSALIREMTMTSDSLGLGIAGEFSVAYEKYFLIVRRITDEYYITLVIKPQGNPGKGRFVLKNAVSKIEKEF